MTADVRGGPGPTTRFRSTRSPFVGQVGKVLLDPVFVMVVNRWSQSIACASASRTDNEAPPPPPERGSISDSSSTNIPHSSICQGSREPASLAGVVRGSLTPRASLRRIAWAWRAAVIGSASGIASAASSVN